MRYKKEKYVIFLPEWYTAIACLLLKYYVEWKEPITA
jgi:hypothetical protein